MMKGILLCCILAFFNGVCLSAGETHGYTDKTKAVMQKIEDANRGVNSVSGGFTQVRRLVSGKEIKSSGKLYVSLPDMMAMLYDVPEGDTFIINHDTMCQRRSKKKSIFDLKKNDTMKSLANTLLWSFSGKILALAEAYDAEVSVSEERGLVKMKLVSGLKTSRGYKALELYYDSRNLHLREMVMIEQSGISTLYRMNDMDTDSGKLPENVFDI